MNSERYILVSENKTFKDIADIMAEGFNKRRPYINVNPLLFRVIYTLMWIKEALGIRSMLSKETTRSSISTNAYDNSKILAVIPFPLRSINDQIKQDCLNYQKKGPPR